MIQFDLFIRGLILGFSIAAPVGPIGVLCIQRSLTHGRRAGFFSGLGAASADAVYGAIAAFGLAGLSAFLVDFQFWLGLWGGLFLLYLGWKVFRSTPAAVDAGLTGNGERNQPKKRLLSYYLSTFALTVTNPMTIISFTAVFAGFGLGSEGSDFRSAWALVSGVFTGSAAWWLTLSLLVGHPRWRVLLGGRGKLWINRVSGAVILIFGVIVLLSLANGIRTQGLNPAQDTAAGGSPVVDLTGYARAAPGVPVVFPWDFGPHPDFQTEWWYYTGNLAGPDGQRYGYQLTFFRRALLPPQLRSVRASDWGVEQVYLAHFAITDVPGGKHYAVEKMARGAAGLAGAAAEPYEVWLEDWSVVETGSGRYLLSVQVPAAEGRPALALRLTMVDVKGPVLQGLEGYSQKGPETGNASFYYSQTRLQSDGSLQIGDRLIEVNGYSWKDHEFSTGALSEGQVGWDWFSVQLDDGRELMFFQLRLEDGSIDPFSSGAVIDPEGNVQRLTREDFSIEVLETWQSPVSGGEYPAGWRVAIPSEEISLEIQPLLADQELDLQYTYWEGAVRVTGSANGQTVTGFGYVEMTGYAGTMAGEF